MLLFRKEKFGGMVFNTSNGHQLALDKGAFELVNKVVAGREKVSDDFLSGLFNDLGVKKEEKYLIRGANTNSNIPPFPFTVLNAPTLVDLQITTKCNLRCPHCYANGSPDGRHIPLKDALVAIENCSRAGAFEIALGGGEPTLHPYFSAFLKEIKKRNMVPNLATNGKRLSDETLDAIKENCGAVALSVEFIGKKFEERRGFPFKDFLESVKKLKNKKIKLVFQVTVSKSNLGELKEISSYLLKFSPYGMVFLTYKPVGRGEFFDDTLFSADDKEKTAEIIKDCFYLLKDKTKAGYDCCLTNVLIGQGLSDDSSLDGCSAVRSSLAINCNLDVVPCSFSRKVLGNLRKDSLLKIWENDVADKFRNEFLSKIKANSLCSGCDYKFNCLGGCPEFDLVKCKEFGDSLVED